MSLLLSIVIPTFNRAGPLADALDSLCSQLSGREEIIVVDDGSTDGTQSVVARFPSVRYVRTVHQGTTRARNVGLTMAQGRFLFPFDSDWILRPTGLAKIRSLIEKDQGNFFMFPCISHPGKVVSTPVTQERSVSAEDLLDESVQELITVVSIELLRDSGLKYPEEYRIVGENLLWIALAKIQPARLFPWVLVTYRTDISNRTCSGLQQLNNAQDMALLSEEWLRQLLEGDFSVEAILRKRITCGVYRVLAGQPGLGRAHLRRCSGRTGRSLRWLSYCPPLFRLMFLIYRRVQPNWYEGQSSDRADLA